MARLLRIQFPGAIYLITARTPGRSTMFRDDEDRTRFLEGLASVQRISGAHVGAYCLTERDITLLVETPRGNLSTMMSRLLTAYTVYFNRKYRRSGPLVRDRFQSLVLDPETVVAMSVELHLKPLQALPASTTLAKRRTALKAHAWSSLHHLVGKAKADLAVDPTWLLSRVKPRRGETRPAAYQRLIDTALEQDQRPGTGDLPSNRMGIGSAEFLAELDKAYAKASGHVRKHGRFAARKVEPSLPASRVLSALAEVIKVKPEDFKVRKYDSILRGYASWALQRYAGCTLEAIGRHLRINTEAAVSIQIRRFTARMDQPDIAKSLRALDKALGGSGKV